MYCFITQSKDRKEYKVLKYRNRIFVIDPEDNSYTIYTRKKFFLNYDFRHKYTCLYRKDLSFL